MTKSRPIPQFIRINKSRVSKHWFWAEHINMEAELVLVKKGKIRCSINGTEFIAQDGDFYFIQSGQMHYEVILSKHLDFFSLHFALLDHMGKSCAIISDCTVKQQCLRGLQQKSARLFERILKLIWDEKPNSEREIEKIILTLIQLIKRRIDENSPEDALDEISSRQCILAENAMEFIKKKSVPQTHCERGCQLLLCFGVSLYTRL